MPNNWKTYKLSDFIDINPLVKLKANESYSFVEMKDLDANNRTVLPSNFKSLNGGARFQNNDTLFARITPCLQNGKICQVKELKENVGFGSTEFLVFRGKKGVSDTNFVYYLSREPFFRQFAENNMIGTSGRQRVAKQAFQNIELELPPLQEQQSIASILSAMDDKIENNLAINKTLEEMAMALYKHWFVDFGPFQDGKFVESELGMIPKGWEVKRLDELAEILNAKRVPLSTNQRSKRKGKYPYYGASGIIDNIDDYVFDGEYVLISEDGENLRSRSTPIAFSAFGKFWVNNHAHILKEKEIGYNYLIICHFSQLDMNPYLTGAVQPKLNKQNLLQIGIPLPKDTKLAKNVFNKFEHYSNQIISNIKENQTLTQLRETLLPKLISGDLRLKEFRETVNKAV